MNKIIKQKWLEALRSGKYEQSKRNLRTDEGYCCLGVLCDLAAEQKVGKWVNATQDRYQFVSPSGRSTDSHFLPPFVRKWAGIKHKHGYKTVINGNAYTLAELNDSGSSFKEIADVIEKHA